MNPTLDPSTPSQQTADGLPVLVKGLYLADRYPDSIITCNQNDDGIWLHTTVYKHGDPDEPSRNNRTSLHFAYDPNTQAMRESIAITNMFERPSPSYRHPHNSAFHSMASFYGGKLKSAILFSDWKQYGLDPSLFPEGHNIAYKCEIVETRPDLPRAYPVQTLPGFSVSTLSEFTASNMSPGDLARDINPL